MCRMVGVVFRSKFPAEVLEDLKEVARTGRIPEHAEPGHRDGWGVVSYIKEMPIYLERRADPIFEDKHYAPMILQTAKLPGPNILIAHARASSGTPASIPNTHPFIAGGLVLAHNGTIYDFDVRTKHRVAGDTDSEKLLMMLADQMDDDGDQKAALKSVIKNEVLPREFTGAVLLVSDGEMLYAYRDHALKKSPNYYDLRVAKFLDYVVVYQETLMTMPPDAFQVKKGELVTIDLNLNVTREMVR